MAPTVILIRHAQAEHIHCPLQPTSTLTIPRDYSIPDPPLTLLGKGQCNELSVFLQNSFPLAARVELIVVSPLRRALQTAQLSLGWLIAQGVPVQLRAEWQENSDNPCDIGTVIDVMRDEWPHFDWSTVDPVFPAKEGLYANSKVALANRGNECRRWLKSRPEKVIAVVSHSAFFKNVARGLEFANTDFRVFEFAEGLEDEGGELVQWKLMEGKGGGRLPWWIEDELAKKAEKSIINEASPNGIVQCPQSE